MQEVCILFWFFICSSRVVAILYYIYTTKIVIIVIPSLCAGRGTQKKETSLCYRSIQLSVGYDFWFDSAFVFVIVDVGRRAARVRTITDERAAVGRPGQDCVWRTREYTIHLPAQETAILSCDIWENFLYDATYFFSIPFDTSFMF